jgi:hypothetical protein
MKTCLVTLALLMAASGAMAQPGGSLDFDGGDYVEIADPIDLGGPLTLEVWIHPDAFDGGRIISNRGGGYEIDTVSDGRVRFTINSSVRASANISAHLGTWVHIAVTWAGPVDGDVILYVNGEVAATSTSTNEIDPPAGVFRIGSQPSNSWHFDGGIDEVRVFSTVVDPSTIALWQTRHMASDHPNYAQLEGAWSFEDGSGQVAQDLLGVRNGTLGSESGADDADPTWALGGLVANENMSLGDIKLLFR